EEEVRIWVSKCIEEKILKPLGIAQYGRYEYMLISGARVDALYGHVIVEFKAPGKLSSESDIARAKQQVIEYIRQEAPSKAEWDRYLGVIISDRIAFVRYYKPQDTWILRGPYDITRESIIKLIEALRGLRRKALKVENLLNDFGPQSNIAKKAVRALYRKLANPRSERTRILFEDWIRLFRQATGYDPSKLKDLPKLASEYGIVDKVNFDALLFAIQTYYAFIIKLLAAEVVYLYGGGRLYKSYIAELDDKYAEGGVDALRDALAELESGGIFRKFGYENFLEGDYFSWYLGELDQELAEILAEIARRLADYEPATPQLEPESARDLLKRLYQHLVPRDIRHNLGEYYTPDWLADLLLNEAGLSLEELERIGREDPLKPLQIRVLDPACGSGTFLVRYIARLRAYAREHFLDDVLTDYLLNNVVGYDLNPLAVLTARTNYLLMIADLPKRRAIEIPVYLADSLMVERRTTLVGDLYVLKTVVGEFQIPVKAVEEGLLPKVLSEVTNALNSRYSKEDFRRRLKHAFKNLTDEEIGAFTDFYATLLKLEEEGKNNVWVSILRNAFAPILKGKFDYVVGNPPWVRWENLPEDYREVSKVLWESYGILGRGAGFKRDLSMLFLTRCFDLYLKPGGKLAFLMPFTVFKTQAGTGFRRFLAMKTKIHVVHDLVTMYPFEGAVNRSSAIVVEKICELSDFSRGECPDVAKVVEGNRRIKHAIWVSEKAVPTDAPLEEVLKTVTRYQAVMVPIDERDPSSPWMQVTEKVLPYIRKVLGSSPYEAHAGVYDSLNQVYYVQIKGKTPDGKLVITNPPRSGQKRQVRQVEAVVEPNLLYPLVRGRDVKKWYVEPSGNEYVILPHDPRSGKPLVKAEFQVMFPGTYWYLSQFKEELKTRSIKPFLSLKDKIKKAKSENERRLALNRLEEMFYIVDNIGSYTFAPYKVVWKNISGAITGKAEFSCAVVSSVDDRYLGTKLVIPNVKLMLIPLNSAEEAYYVSGVLNSAVIRFIVASYVIETGISTHIIENIRIPKFNSSDPIHIKIAELSRRAHELAKCIYAVDKPAYCSEVRNPLAELERVEEEIDRLVAGLYGIPEEALQDIKNLLAILKAEEVPEGGGEEEEEISPSIEFVKTEVIADHEDFIEFSVVTAGKCDRARLVLEGPWGVRELSLGEGRHRFEVNLPEGVYEVKYRFTCGEYSCEGSINVTSSASQLTGPRRPRTLTLG
ncbi:MAG: N-6 DNA methylase, partial [Thermosphaera sp.]